MKHFRNQSLICSNFKERSLASLDMILKSHLLVFVRNQSSQDTTKTLFRLGETICIDVCDIGEVRKRRGLKLHMR